MSPPPCIIGILPHARGNPLVISLRQIIGDLVLLLKVCEDYGNGGWIAIEGTSWALIVNGPIVVSGLHNETSPDAVF